MRTGKREGVTGVNKGVTPSFDVNPSQLRQTPGYTGRNMGLTTIELLEQQPQEDEGYIYYCSCIHCCMVHAAHGSFILAGDTVHSKTHSGAAQAFYALQRKGAGGC